MIAETPKMFEHRSGGKRASEQTREQTLRQIRWAASLLERSTPAGQPLWKLSTADLKELDSWFDHLPISFGKSPADRRGDMTLALARERALARLEDGEIEADEIGLTIPTCNKHNRKIAQVHAFLVQAVRGIPALDFGSSFSRTERTSVPPDCAIPPRKVEPFFRSRRGQAVLGSMIASPRATS